MSWIRGFNLTMDNTNNTYVVWLTGGREPEVLATPITKFRQREQTLAATNIGIILSLADQCTQSLAYTYI
jgi:LmbE family N-acetylglucosaminyl deacetylase